MFEVAALQAPREQLRCKEIWVVGADAWRNPDQGLPADFEQRRTENYQGLRKLVIPSVFIDHPRTEMTRTLSELETALPRLDWVRAEGDGAGNHLA